MSVPLAYLNGRLVPATEALVPVYDGGFVQGVTVAEQLRTFAGRLFRLPEHLARLEHSLGIVEVRLDTSTTALAAAAQELVAHNHPLLSAGHDLGLTLFVTPGPYGAMAPAEVERRPLVCMHTFPLAFSNWAAKYRSGEHLATTNVEQVSARCWPPELKCRSRVHYFLADRQARRRDPAARAAMLDHDGFVTEATTANLLIYRQGGGLFTPPRAKVLPGISLAVLSELAAQLRLPLAEADLRPEDVTAADEVLLCSTSPCVLPVTVFNGQAIGTGQPGPIFDRLIAAWSDQVGLDIVAQAERLAGL